MKTKVFMFLAVVLVLITSLSVLACSNDAPAKFQVADLAMSPGSNVDIGTAVTISAKVTNTGGTSGNHTVTCAVNGSIIGNQSLELAAEASQTVSFTYTPFKDGTIPVTVENLSGTITAIRAEEYWEVKYNVVNGSRMTLNYSLMQSLAKHIVINLSKGDGTVTMCINRTIVNGTREIKLLSTGWQIKSLYVKDLSPGTSMNLVISLPQDAEGVLYVESGKGSADISSLSSLITNPKQTDTFASGNNAPAGSMVVKANLLGNADTSVGIPIVLPFGLLFTTGNITNVVSLPKSKFNNAKLSSQGVPFAKDGGVAPYVGTAGTITSTGTGNCLGLTLAGFPIDLQTEIKLVLEPESVK